MTWVLSPPLWNLSGCPTGGCSWFTRRNTRFSLAIPPTKTMSNFLFTKSMRLTTLSPPQRTKNCSSGFLGHLVPSLPFIYADAGTSISAIRREQSAFLVSFGYSFSSLADPAARVKTLYNVEGIPPTILIDRQGKIKTYDVGTATYESLWEALQALGISAE